MFYIPLYVFSDGHGAEFFVLDGFEFLQRRFITHT